MGKPKGGKSGGGAGPGGGGNGNKSYKKTVDAATLGLGGGLSSVVHCRGQSAVYNAWAEHWAEHCVSLPGSERCVQRLGWALG